MAECNPVSLAGNGCWNCLTSGQQQAAILNLLCQILQALDPMADCDPQTLAGDGCTSCLMPGQLNTAIAGTLCAIVDSLPLCDPTGGAAIPEGNVTGNCPFQIYSQVVGGFVNRIWVFTGTVGTKTGWI